MSGESIKRQLQKGGEGGFELYHVVPAKHSASRNLVNQQASAADIRRTE